jgi:hypothetical protein
MRWVKSIGCILVLPEKILMQLETAWMPALELSFDLADGWNRMPSPGETANGQIL